MRTLPFPAVLLLPYRSPVYGSTVYPRSVLRLRLAAFTVPSAALFWDMVPRWLPAYPNR